MDVVQIWWPDLEPTIPFVIRLQHDDEDLILHDKAL